MYSISNVIDDLKEIINENVSNFKLISEEEFSHKELQDKWSKREILGHLIDSAQNNIQRFIRGQYEKSPKIIYDPDLWVILNQYKEYGKSELIDLWALLNKQIVHIWEHVPSEKLTATCDIGESEHDFKNIQWLAEDYVAHLRHHISQIS